MRISYPKCTIIHTCGLTILFLLSITRCMKRTNSDGDELKALRQTKTYDIVGSNVS